MNRLQKKCFIASAGLHLLLALILFVGPAFVSSKSKPDTSAAILDIIPAKLIDAPFYNSGGLPRAAQVAQPVTPVQPVQPPVQPKQPEAVKLPDPEPPKTLKDDSESLEMSEKRPKISLTKVVRKTDAKATKRPSTADQQERQQADAARRAADLIASASRTLGKQLSGGSVEVSVGDGRGTGEAYAPYDDAVRSIYYHAWVPPQESSVEKAIVRAKVTIARDGRVISHSITRGSGNESVDQSVALTLERVTEIRPFPEGSKDKQRTYNIVFDLAAKRLNE